VAAVAEGAAHLGALPSISLPQLVALADLQHRFESKYIVPIDRIPSFVGELARRTASLKVLEIDGRRSHGHANEYFDSPDLRLYRDHAQGRRRRYKVRTRRYESDPLVYAELKTKDGRGRTLKHRVMLPGMHMTQLPADVVSSFHARLQQVHTDLAPVELTHSASVRYRRGTLVLEGDTAGPAERVTIDWDLAVGRGGARRQLGRSHVIVEVKGPRPHGAAASALVSLGHRPISLSKYCLAVAAVDDAARSHPWVAVLRLLGGDQRS
jgi:hypothetical protein